MTDQPQPTHQQEQPPKQKSRSNTAKRKAQIIILAIVFFAAGAGVAWYARPHLTKQNNQPAVQQQSLVGSSDYSDIDACDVLRQKDVESVLGLTVIKENATYIDDDKKAPTTTLCVYSAGKDRVKDLTRLTLDHYLGDASKAKSTYETYKAAAVEKQKAEAVNGVGDGAFWTPGTSTSLTVLKGDTIFVLTLGDPATEKRTLDRTKDLGIKVLRRY